MGAFSVGGISQNATEDLIDEGVSNLVYSMGNCYFGDKSIKNPKCDNIVSEAWDEALSGASQTLKFSIMNAVIFRVTDYALAKILIGSTSLFAYIKAGRVINTVKRKVKSAASGIPFFGRAIGETLTVATSLSVGNQNERLAMAKMGNDNMNNITNMIGQERQTATIQASTQKKQIMQTLGLNQKSKGLSDTKKLEAYHYKMKTGTWTTSKIDKNLFISVVPREFIGVSFLWNNSFIDKLNKFTEYARSTENELVNIAQTQLDTLTVNSMSKIK